MASMRSEAGTKLVAYAEVIVQWRKLILRIVFGVTLAAIVVSLVVRQQFTATTTILPPSTDQQSMVGLMSSMIGGDLTGLSSLGRGLPGVATLSDLFAAIMKSGNIRNRVIDSLELMQAFRAKKRIDAHRTLDGITRITILPEGIITVSVTYHDRQLAARIANAYVEELDRFNKETAMTMGKRYRMFIEEQVEETKNAVLMAQEALQRFQSEHKTVALEQELESAIEGVAQIKGQIVALEVRRNVIMSSAAPNSPLLRDIDRQLSELKRQLTAIEFGGGAREGFGAGSSIAFADMPELYLQYAGLMREVKIQEAIYEVLMQQYEQARIMEAKDTPTVQVLDAAGPPEERSFPRRKRIVLIAFVASIMIGIGVAIFLERMRVARKQQDADFLRWRAILATARQDIANISRTLVKPFNWMRK